MSFAHRISFLSFIGGIWICFRLLHTDFGQLGFEIASLVTIYFACLGALGGRIMDGTRRYGIEEDKFWGKFFMSVVFLVIWLVLTNYTGYNGFVVTTFVILFLEAITIYSIVCQIRKRNTRGSKFRFTSEEIAQQKTDEVLDKITEEQVIKEGIIIDETSRGKLFQHKKYSDIKVLQYEDKKLEVQYVEFVLPDIMTVEDAFKKKWQLGREDTPFFTGEG